MLTWLKFGGYIALASVVAFTAWSIKGKIDRAAEADRLETEAQMAQQELERIEKEIEGERDLRQKADEDRVKISGELDKARKELADAVKKAVKTIRVAVPDDRACDIPVEVLQELNRARGYPE